MNEIEEIPEPLLSEVLLREKLDIAVMSETSLEKDWMTPEEDEAWQSL
jgi:hypothetical protein